METLIKWTVVLTFIAIVVGKAAMTTKPREMIQPEETAISAVYYILLIIGVINYW